MRGALFIHLLFMLLGYALAVLVSVTIAVFVMGLPTVLPDNGNWGSFYSFWRDFPNLFLGGLTITALYALPGWLISVVAAEFRNERRRFWFAAAGVLTALLALFLAGMGRGLMSMPAMFVGSLTGGFFGGLVYWAVTGKRSGDWRSLPEPAIRENPADEGTLK
jgi:energy-converting hydrogenase Eha subunit A